MSFLEGFQRLSLLVPNFAKISSLQSRSLNCNRAVVTKTSRTTYLRKYPTVLVLQDGSTINVDYKEPRKIIKFPLDLSTLSEAERQKRLERRRPKKKVKIEEDMDDSFDVNRYAHLWKK